MARLAPFAVFATVLALLAPNVAGRGSAVHVRPNPAHLRDTLTFSWRGGYRSDNPLDGYLVSFNGPGGVHCDVRTNFGGNAGLATSFSLSSRREKSPPPEIGLAWCPGAYKGKVVFRDLPHGKSAPVIYRLVGRFRVSIG